MSDEWDAFGVDLAVHLGNTDHPLMRRFRALPVPTPAETGLRERIEALPTVPFYAPRENEYMCPNCVTPWKCNGPHIPEDGRKVAGHFVVLDQVLAALSKEEK